MFYETGTWKFSAAEGSVSAGVDFESPTSSFWRQSFFFVADDGAKIS